MLLPILISFLVKAVNQITYYFQIILNSQNKQ